MRSPRLWLMVGAATAIFGGAVVTYVVHVDQMERPTDQALIQIFHAHVAELERAQCQQGGPSPAPADLRTIGVEYLACDYDGMLRLGFGGNRLGLAIGPGWTKGLTRLNGDPKRKGTLVTTTDGARRLPADVYLRPIRDGWYIYYQRDE